MNAISLYLDLIEKVLTGIHNISDPEAHQRRLEGHDWPDNADTMIGLRRLRNIRDCMNEILRTNVPGDVIEAGVWRGGATIFMRAILKAHADADRKVWVADSFAGLPPPDPNYPADEGDTHHQEGVLTVPIEVVQHNFAKYDLLDDRVCFLKGWFKDTLFTAPIESLSLIRLDGDMYESTIQGLQALYPKLSVGGYLIVDDYLLRGCRQAVHDYRGQHGIKEVMHKVGERGSSGTIYWRKE